MLENPESPLTHIQNIISVLGGPRHAFAILQSRGKYLFNTCPVFSAVKASRKCFLFSIFWAVRKFAFFGGREGVHCRGRLHAPSKVALVVMEVMEEWGIIFRIVH